MSKRKYNRDKVASLTKEIDYITPMKHLLDENMHKICLLFVTIGFPEESPRWFNFREYDLETDVLTIGSTQTQRLYFDVDLTEVDLDTKKKYLLLDSCTIFWNQFKEYRTNFLQENYPTIKTI